jgi:hypothetical protein
MRVHEVGSTERLVKAEQSSNSVRVVGSPPLKKDVDEDEDDEGLTASAAALLLNTHNLPSLPALKSMLALKGCMAISVTAIRPPTRKQTNERTNKRTNEQTNSRQVTPIATDTDV